MTTWSCCFPCNQASLQTYRNLRQVWPDPEQGKWVSRQQPPAPLHCVFTCSFLHRLLTTMRRAAHILSSSSGAPTSSFWGNHPPSLGDFEHNSLKWLLQVASPLCPQPRLFKQRYAGEEWRYGGHTHQCGVPKRVWLSVKKTSDYRENS